MAKLKHGIFGPISGKLGSLVGGTWKNIPYLREAPKKKNKPALRSEAQIANEQKMKFVNEVLVPFHPFINVGFQHLAIAKTAISAAYSLNFYQAITGTYPNLAADYSKLVISKGNLSGLINPLITRAADELHLIWENGTGNKAAYNDQLMFVVYAPALNIADGFIGAALRRDLQLSFKLNLKMASAVLEVYVALTSFDRKKIADSLYLGRILP